MDVDEIMSNFQVPRLNEPDDSESEVCIYYCFLCFCNVSVL